MRRPPASLRHITAHRLAFAAVALTVVFTTSCTAAAASFASTVTGNAVRSSLAADQGNTIGITAPATAADAAHVSAIVTATIRTAASGLPVAFSASLQSQYLNLPAGGAGGPHAQTQIISLPALERHATLVSGSWPAGDAPGPAAAPGPVGVCIPARPARLLRIAAGAALTLRDSVTKIPVTVRVACVFRPDRPQSPYWSISPLGRSGVEHSGGFSIYGPLVTTQAVITSGRVPVVSGAWVAVPDFGRLRASNLTTLSNRISAASGALVSSTTLAGAGVSTRLPGLLDTLATSLVVARSQLLIGVLILLVIAGAALAVTVRLLAMQREAEAALLAARGASRRQLAARGITDALLLAIPAAVAGPFIGSWLVPLIAHFGSPTLAGLRLHLGQPVSAWLASAAVAAGCALIISLPWLRQPPSPVRQRAQRGRQQVTGTVVSAGADLALVALAAGAGWELARYSAPVTTGIDGSVGVDPILVSAPVLALAAGTLVMLRLLPVATRLGDRAAARGRGLTVAVAAWQISRRPLRQAGPALLAVLAVATAVITLAETSSWHRSVQNQASFAVGADTRITLPPAASLPIGQVAAITAARGVLATTPAVRTVFSLPQGGICTLLALDARAAASIIPLRAEETGGSAAALLRRLAPKTLAPGVPIPGRAARLRITARLDGAGIAEPVLSVQLTDAAGVGYLVSAGSLPADGRSHELTATIAAGNRADYPVRLTGFALGYLESGTSSAAATLGIESVAAAAAMQGPFGHPFPAAATTGPRMVAIPGGVSFNAPQATTVQVLGGGINVPFQTGSMLAHQSAPATLTVTAGAAVPALPALATRSFLEASGARLGSIVQVEVQGTALPVTPVAELSRFATVTAPSGGLVVDQEALQDALRERGVAPAPVTEWWLKTSGTPVLLGLPQGTAITSSAALARSLSLLPLSAAPLQALVAIAAAALILACGGFVISVVTGRERQRDVALLDALGARAGQVVRLLCLEQAMLAVPAAAAGLLLGALLSHLIIPAVSLTAQATHPDPPVLVQVPWPLAIGIAVIIASVPALATALAATRRIAVAARLRVEEET